jgi:hypothetical protein
VSIEETDTEIPEDVRVSGLGGVQLADMGTAKFHPGGKTHNDRKGDPDPFGKFPGAGAIGKEGIFLGESSPSIKIA